MHEFKLKMVLCLFSKVRVVLLKVSLIVMHQVLRSANVYIVIIEPTLMLIDQCVKF